MNDPLVVAGSGAQALPAGSIVSRLRSFAARLRLDRGPGADRRPGRAGARARGGRASARKSTRKGSTSSSSARTASACRRRSRPCWRRTRDAAQPDRLGLRQQFRQAGPADRHRTAVGPRARLHARRCASSSKTSRSPRPPPSRAKTTRRGAARSTKRSRRSSSRRFRRAARKGGAKGDPLLRTPDRASRWRRSQNGQVVPPDEFNAWPEAERRQAQADIEALRERSSNRSSARCPQWDKRAARRRARAQSGNRQVRGRSSDRGGRGRLSPTSRASPSISTRCAPT